MKVEYVKKEKEFRPYKIIIENETEDLSIRRILHHCKEMVIEQPFSVTLNDKIFFNSNSRSNLL